MSQKLCITAMQFPNKLNYIPAGSMRDNPRLKGSDKQNRKYIHRCSVCQFGSTRITEVSTAVQTTISVIFMSRINLCSANCTYTVPWLFPHKIAYSFLVYVKLLTRSFLPFSTLLSVTQPALSNQGYKSCIPLSSWPLSCHFYTRSGAIHGTWASNVIHSSCHLRFSHTYKSTYEINFSISFKFFCLNYKGSAFRPPANYKYINVLRI